MEKEIIRISVTGPESTGKSWLAEKLANHYHTQWVPEYARPYLENLGRTYTVDDILEIAKGQLALEELTALKANRFLFCDTDLLVTRIWSEFKYGKVHPWITRMYHEHKYALYLLCDIDLPWTPDPLREHPHQRRELFSKYLEALKSDGFPFCIVKGTGLSRLENACVEIEKYWPAYG